MNIIIIYCGEFTRAVSLFIDEFSVGLFVIIKSYGDGENG